MNIERTPDKVVLTPSEITTIVKAFIEQSTGRKIQGDINFSQTGSGGSFTTGAWCYLYQLEQNSGGTKDA